MEGQGKNLPETAHAADAANAEQKAFADVLQAQIRTPESEPDQAAAAPQRSSDGISTVPWNKGSREQIGELLADLRNEARTTAGLRNEARTTAEVTDAVSSQILNPGPDSMY